MAATPLSNAECAVRARNLLTERSEALSLTIPSIQAMIPTVLESWARACFANREKRELLKVKFAATVTAGRCDLENFVHGTSGRINLKELRETPIYMEDTSGFGTLVRQITATLVGPTMTSAALFVAADVGRLVERNSDDVYVGRITDFTSTSLVTTDSVIAPFGPVAVNIHDPIKPMTWINSEAQLQARRPFSDDTAAVFLDGRKLRTRKGDSNFATFAISFTVTQFPLLVTAIPDQLEQDFIEQLAMAASRSWQQAT
jgi:hypothetical protein